MTLQLRVGGTYRARNGDVVRIIDREARGLHPFRGDDSIHYAEDGRYSVADVRPEFDLVEEIPPPSPASGLDAAIAKFEEAWATAKRAMDKTHHAAENVAKAIRAAKEPTNEQG